MIPMSLSMPWFIVSNVSNISANIFLCSNITEEIASAEEDGDLRDKEVLL